MAHGVTLLDQVLIIITAIVLVSSILQRFRIPPILIYLFIGILLGPTGLALIKDEHAIHQLAEFGVVFLLFTLGLEFSLPKLLSTKQTVFGLGSIQMAICTGLFFMIAYVYGVPTTGAMIAAVILALSSTAIVSKELTERRLLQTRTGQLSIGILLFQDLIAVLFLSLIPALAGSTEQSNTHPLIILTTAVFFLLIMMAVGRMVLPILFQSIAKSGSQEFFVFTSLMVALSSAYLTQWVGLSMSLGAFIAGMLLGESHYKHQIEAEIRPFQDVLLGIFFVSIGMILDLTILKEYWLRIVFFTLGLILFKLILITLATRLFGETPRNALRTGILLAQGGEFGFVLLALSKQYQLLPEDVSAFTLSIIILSMALNSLLIYYHAPLIQWIFRKSSQPDQPETNPTSIPALSAHVLICGYGRIGQTIARYLQAERIPYLGIDDDPVRVSEAITAGEKVVYGNCQQLALLEQAGLARAKLLVVSFDQVDTTLNILHQVRARCPNLNILVRTRDSRALEALLAAGANEVIPETLEASLMLVSQVMMQCDVPNQRIESLLSSTRQAHYNQLHGFYLGARVPVESIGSSTKIYLHPITLTPESNYIGQTLQSLSQDLPAVTLEGIRKQGGDKQAINLDFILEAGDIIILKGSHENIYTAETLLLKPA